MQYTYKAAWSVVGGINLPATAGLVELSKTGSCRFVLTNDVNELLADIDIDTAIGRLMLKTLVGQHKAQDFVDVIASEVEEIRVERRKKVASSPVLVAIASVTCGWIL